MYHYDKIGVKQPLLPCGERDIIEIYRGEKRRWRKRGIHRLPYFLKSKKKSMIISVSGCKNILIKAELIIAVIGSVISFEIANAVKILQLYDTAVSVKNMRNILWYITGNFPYLISLITLLFSIFVMISVFVSLKCRTVDVAKLYNKKVYKMSEEDLLPYLTALYAKCNAYNFSRINSYYKKINAVIILTIVSIVLFGAANII